MSSRALREGFSTLLSTSTGKAGLIMLIVLASISVYVVLTYPLDFGTRVWNNPSLWADYPKAVPPSWVSSFSATKEVPHMILEASRPTSVTEGVKFYEFRVSFNYDKAPSLLSLTVSGVTYYSGDSPMIALSVFRPDGESVTLIRYVIPGPRAGEGPPFERYHREPLRFYLSGDVSAASALSNFLAEKYGIFLSPQELVDVFNKALFGVPAERDGEVTFRVLKGEYVFVVRLVVGDQRDEVGRLRLVIGGTTYGIMGTDSVGRDLFTGLLFGFPVALFIGLIASVLSTALGTALGTASGYIGGKVDVAIQRLADIVANVPLLPILIFLSFVFRPSILLIALILVAFGWPGLAIVVRSMVLQAKTGAFIEAAKVIGSSRLHIMVRHVFPQVAPFVISQMIFFVPSAILAEAALSFLGLGDPSVPTWGGILEHAFRTGAVFIGYWWWVIPPGLLLVVTSLSFVLLALGTEQVINPRLRVQA